MLCQKFVTENKRQIESFKSYVNILSQNSANKDKHKKYPTLKKWIPILDKRVQSNLTKLHWKILAQKFFASNFISYLCSKYETGKLF